MWVLMCVCLFYLVFKFVCFRVVECVFVLYVYVCVCVLFFCC